MAKAGEGLCTICGAYLKTCLGDGGLQVYCPVCLTGSTPKKPHKYRAEPTEVDGIRFPSKREANRYSELKLMERAGEITNLQLQPRYPLIVEGVKVCTYVADFAYVEEASALLKIEDCKGVKTPVYRLKKKLFEALYDRKILET